MTTKTRRRGLLFALATIGSWALYAPFLSVQWDLNGIIEARAVDAGGAGLFSPNHLLFRPLGYLLLQVAGLVGYDGPSASLLQYVSAASGAVGVGVFFLALCRLTDDEPTSAVAACFLATSWSYWKFSTDTSYITSAALMVSIALYLVLRSRHTLRSALLAGLALGIAVLFFQAVVLIAPAAVVLLLWRCGEERAAVRARLAVAYVLSAGMVALATYVVVGTAIVGNQRLVDLAGWAIGHSSDSAGRPPMWGRWGVDRLGAAVTNAVGSFVPVWQGLGLRQLLKGSVQPDKLLPQVSLLALLLAGGGTAILLVRRLARDRQRRSVVAVLCLGYLAFLLFIVWWEPFETRWFIVPNLLLIGVCGLAWGADGGRGRLIPIGACIALIGMANFSSTIWPYHFNRNSRLELARCFAGQMRSIDAFVATDWLWVDYASYFFGYRGEILQLRGGSSDRREILARIEEELARRRELGGRLYRVDPRSYPPEVQRYFADQVGIPFDVLEEFGQGPGFECEGWMFSTIMPGG